MHITFVYPRIMYINKKKIFALEPPVFARLKALTPRDVQCVFFDERIDNIDYDIKTDLVVISITTYTALNGYKIAQKFRAKGIKVLIGGLHVSLCPEEVKEYADCIVCGEAEYIWCEILSDLRNNNLKLFYESQDRCNLIEHKDDRSIFKNKKYFPVSNIEIGRGCPNNCNFCALAVMYKHKPIYRPVDDIISEIKTIKNKYIAFTDNNIGFNNEYRKELFTKLIPLKKRWLGQVSVNMLKDEEIVKLMKESGCLNLLIGFETLDSQILNNMNKISNPNIEDYEKIIKICQKYDITITGAFIVGYDGDTKENANKTFEFANSHQFFFCTIGNLMPYPGTPIYEKLKNEKRLTNEKWWLQPIHPFSRALFKSENFTNEDFENLGWTYFQKYLSLKNIFKRFLKSKYRFKTRFFIFFSNLFFKYNIWALE